MNVKNDIDEYTVCLYLFGATWQSDDTRLRPRPETHPPALTASCSLQRSSVHHRNITLYPLTCLSVFRWESLNRACPSQFAVGALLWVQLKQTKKKPLLFLFVWPRNLSGDFALRCYCTDIHCLFSLSLMYKHTHTLMGTVLIQVHPLALVFF